MLAAILVLALEALFGSITAGGQISSRRPGKDGWLFRRVRAGRPWTRSGSSCARERTPDSAISTRHTARVREAPAIDEIFRLFVRTHAVSGVVHSHQGIEAALSFLVTRRAKSTCSAPVWRSIETSRAIWCLDEKSATTISPPNGSDHSSCPFCQRRSPVEREKHAVS